MSSRSRSLLCSKVLSAYSIYRVFYFVFFCRSGRLVLSPLHLAHLNMTNCVVSSMVIDPGSHIQFSSSNKSVFHSPSLAALTTLSKQATCKLS